MLVTGNLLPGASASSRQLGRTFRPTKIRCPDATRWSILGHEFWQQQFGADPSILGRTVRLNGIDFTVIGVDARRVHGSRSVRARTSSTRR